MGKGGAPVEVLGLLMIFGARILDVSCNTIRILFLVKGQRFVAACIGFFEVMIYMLVLGILLGGGKTLSTLELLFYCGGFAAGNYVGSCLEERLMNSAPPPQPPGSNVRSTPRPVRASSQSARRAACVLFPQPSIPSIVTKSPRETQIPRPLIVPPRPRPPPSP